MDRKRLTILLFTTYCLLFTKLLASGEDRVFDFEKRIVREKGKLERVKHDMEIDSKRLEGITRKKKDTLRELRRLEKDLDGERRKLYSLNSELSMLRNKIRSIKEEMTAISENLDIKKKILEKRIIAIYKLGGLDFIKIFSSTRSFSDSIKKFRFMRLIALKNANLIKEMENERKRILEKGTILKAEYERVEELKNRQSSIYNERKAEKEEREKLIAKLDRDETTYRKRIADLKKASSRLERLIKELESKTKKRYVKKEGFRKKIPWPVASREILVNFGKYTKFGVESVNKGIDISCNGPVMAVSRGKVVYANWLKGYENLVMIDHGSGFYSVYANLSRIKVEVGQEVEASTLIGEVERTLHFEIRINGEAVNPLDWLS
ncbi:MAG: peptidoglycan DD-metalloendopeptidase family protein [bacterium]|nr:peptidoglycan DD-metalloendopeptidase family protein [bacterium]